MSTIKCKSQKESRLTVALLDMFPERTFTQNDLRNPTTDFVIGFYLDFLSNLGLNTDALNQVPPAMYDKFGDTYRLRKISVVLRDIFNKILLDEIAPFGLVDLLQPTQGRTAAFFLGMSNFLSYVINRLGILDDHIEKLEAEKNEYDELLKKREHLREKLNNAASTRARISDIKVEVENKQLELRNIIEKIDPAEKLGTEKEKIVKDLEEKLSEVNKDLFEAQQKMSQTEALLVRSPDSIRNQKCQLEQKLVEVEENTNLAKDTLTSRNTIVDKLESLVKELDSWINLLKKLIFESKEMSNDKKCIEEERRKLSTTTEDKQGKDAEHQKLRERRAQVQETESGLQLRCETKRKEFQERIKVIKSDLNSIIQQTSKEKLSLASAIDQCCGRISHLVNIYTKLCKEYEEMYNTLLQKERSLCDEADEELQDVISKFR